MDYFSSIAILSDVVKENPALRSLGAVGMDGTNPCGYVSGKGSIGRKMP